MHRRDVGLSRLAFTDAVGAGFSEQQGLLTGDVLQPREIGAQLRFAMQVDIERADVEEREIEKLGRWKVDVGEEALRRRVFRVFVQLVEKAFDTQAPVPTHDIGRNLVTERESEQCRMRAELLHLRCQLLPDATLQTAIVKKGDVLRPGKPGHHAQPVLRGFIEQIYSRRGVSADGVEAEARHQAEVRGDLGQWRKLIAVSVGCEGAVGDTLNEEPFGHRLAETSRPWRCARLGLLRWEGEPPGRAALGANLYFSSSLPVYPYAPAEGLEPQVPTTARIVTELGFEASPAAVLQRQWKIRIQVAAKRVERDQAARLFRNP